MVWAWRPQGKTYDQRRPHPDEQAHHVQVASVRRREQRALQVLLLLVHHARGIHRRAALRQRQHCRLVPAHHRPAGSGGLRV